MRSSRLTSVTEPLSMNLPVGVAKIAKFVLNLRDNIRSPIRKLPGMTLKTLATHWRVGLRIVILAGFNRQGYFDQVTAQVFEKRDGTRNDTQVSIEPQRP